MNRQFIYGNWKMAQNMSGLKSFFEKYVDDRPKDTGVEMAVFPSFLHLNQALAHRGPFLIGAQDCSTEKEGAFTGEVSAQSLSELGTNLVLIGHSERRRRVPETLTSLSSKIDRAKSAALRIVFCLGETEEERLTGKTLSVLKEQLEALQDPSLNPRLLIAYEPVWAIGTGKVASTADIEEAHSFLRKWAGDQVPLLYGGSVNPKNAAEILKIPYVDGVLVGGASLKADDFKAIAKASPVYIPPVDEPNNG